jgi:predicted nucleic acid-binding Zn ribbon protein
MSILDDFDNHVTSTSTADIRKRRKANNRAAYQKHRLDILAQKKALRDAAKPEKPAKPCLICKQDFKAISREKICSDQCRSLSKTPYDKAYYEAKKATKLAQLKTKKTCTICKKKFSKEGKPSHKKTCSPECSDLLFAKTKQKNRDKKRDRLYSQKQRELNKDAVNAKRRELYQAKKEAKANDTAPV